MRQTQASNESVFVGTVQADTEDLEWKLQNHHKSCQDHLQKELIYLLVKHQDAIALPGDALGKTNVLKHKIKLKLEHSQYTFQLIEWLTLSSPL